MIEDYEDAVAEPAAAAPVVAGGDEVTVAAYRVEVPPLALALNPPPAAAQRQQPATDLMTPGFDRDAPLIDI